MAESNNTGKLGEEAATSYLKIFGCTILHTNWRFRQYELDIVATDGEELVVVEVKTRSENHWISPETAVDIKKIHRIVTATEAYIDTFGTDLPVRFDVIIMIKKKDSYLIDKHIKDAFYAPTT